MPRHPKLPWLDDVDDFPPVEQAWDADSDAPGLLVAGGNLSAETLLRAYSNGIFPWYSDGQPPLWWCPDPRMVLHVNQFKLHRSLKKVLKHFRYDAHCEIRFDSDFAQVIGNCAKTSRLGQRGTWILPEMEAAYCAFHGAGYAHSVETWKGGELVGGLYCVAIGQAIFGESMFSHQNDASKLALSALICFCREKGVRFIDCQQNTRHLASLGAAEIPRTQFVAQVSEAIQRPSLRWEFDTLYWKQILDT